MPIKNISVVVLLALAALFPMSAAAADQITAFTVCNGRLVPLKYAREESKCNPDARFAMSTVAPGLQTQFPAPSVDPNLIGNKTLTVCNGRWIASDGSRGTFADSACLTWPLNVQGGQTYPAGNAYQAGTVYFGDVLGNFGSSLELSSDVTNPYAYLLLVRLNAPRNDQEAQDGNPPFWLEVHCDSFRTGPIQMEGIITSTFYDYTVKNGYPVPVTRYHADCKFGPSMP